MSFEVESEGIEKIIIKKLQFYRGKSNFSYALKFINIFLISTIIIAVFLTLWFIFSNTFLKDIKIFKLEETKALEVLFSFYLKEISTFLDSKYIKIFSTSIAILFFLFNLTYAIKRYIFSKNLFR